MQDKTFKERAFFLERSNKNIYCVEYIPAKEICKHLGIILCKPIWGERIRTHRIFTNLARTLALEGFSVLTFDYFGDGNSGGNTISMSFFTMVEDVLELSKYLVDEHNVDTYALIGLLVGSNVAMYVEPKLPGLKKMILFEPFLNPIEIFKHALRANLSSQMVVHKKIIKNREELIDDLKNDIPVNIDGFVIGKTFWESFEKISPFTINSDFKGVVSVYSMIEKGRKGTDYSRISDFYTTGDCKAIEKEFIWTDWKYYIPYPEIFINTIKEELLK